MRSLLLAILLASAGCVYKGAMLVEGTDLAIGINVPTTGGALQFQLFNYLSGFRLGIAENSRLTVDYTVAETNSFLGLAETQVYKRIKATVEPCEVEAQVLEE